MSVLNKAVILSVVATMMVITTPAAQAVSTESEERFQGPAYVERMLIGFCRAAMQDNVGKLVRSIRESRLHPRKVALGVVCNGDDIKQFAARYQAQRAYHWLNTRLPVSLRKTDVDIRDIAGNEMASEDTVVVASLN